MTKIESALRECESQKKAILDGCAQLIFLLDKDHRIIWANKSVNRLCPDPEGRSCYEIFCEDNTKCVKCQVTASFKAGKEYESSIKAVVRAAKDREAYFGLHCSPVIGNEGEVNNVVVIAEEITERLNLLKQLRNSFNMEAIGTLAGGIAHDFNNILTPILGYSEILRLDFSSRDEGDWSDTLASLNQIIEASKRAQKLVKQFMIYSGKATTKDTVQPVHALILESLKVVKASLPDSVEFHQLIDTHCGMIQADPLEIHQIILDLCKNAVEAMVKKGGKLTVSLQKSYFTEEPAKWVELSVSDSGCGIPEDLQSRIFEPYFSTKEKGQGTGMGLAMVHGIVHRLGGRISVDSMIDVGTMITLHLPVLQEAEEEEKEVSMSKYAGKGEHILLVDDEIQVVKSTAGMLRKLGYTVTEMTSAQKALERFSAEHQDFDLVITDLAMPRLSGLELCQKLKDARRDIPVLLYSGALDEKERAEAQQLGVDGFCLKPLTLKELARKVHQILL